MSGNDEIKSKWLQRLLHLLLQLSFRKYENRSKRIDPQVSISMKLEVSSSTNSACVKSVQNLEKGYNYLWVFCGKPASRGTPTDLVSVPHEICMAIYLPLGSLCDSEQKQRKQVWDSKDKGLGKNGAIRGIKLMNMKICWHLTWWHLNYLKMNNQQNLDNLKYKAILYYLHGYVCGWLFTFMICIVVEEYVVI